MLKTDMKTTFDLAALEPLRAVDPLAHELVATNKEIAAKSNYKNSGYFIEHAYSDGELVPLGIDIVGTVTWRDEEGYEWTESETFPVFERSSNRSHSYVADGQNITHPNSGEAAGFNLRTAESAAQSERARANTPGWTRVGHGSNAVEPDRSP